MKRKELMAIVALAAGLSAGVATTTEANAGSRFQQERGDSDFGNGRSFGHGRFDVGFDFGFGRPGHFIGRGHFQHGNGHGWGHNHHDHDIY